MNREQMVERVARAIHADDIAHDYAGDDWPNSNQDWFRSNARAALDAVLPQVTTAAELEALPVGTIVLSGGAGLAYRADAGETGRRWWWATGQAASWTSPNLALRAFLPLTVVWQPS